MCSVAASDSPVSTSMYEVSKKVWIWTENSQVMTAAVERGWDTFLFSLENQGLATDGFDSLRLKELQPDAGHIGNFVIDLQDWQVIPAENIGRSFKGVKQLCLPSRNHLQKHNYFLRLWSTDLGTFSCSPECLESNYIASRPFRVNAGPVHAYVAVPGAIVGRVKIETRPLILVEAKIDANDRTIQHSSADRRNSRVGLSAEGLFRLSTVI
ncbi:hypothetical protein F3Y22_tig00110388pilonHSYRG00146 [Hibiscus syriacus]|uniref:3-dehydroquinate synthase C-terminal domain-containing protein n=1 Tax=Hibiscus syriacus TaxID=106335 RepID=A0A6A3AUE8_HIBSY|nr:hypothetical protein F3Y22_tig00110388pilonHSYRG00146 [Hibiscus syriacus]